LLDLYPTYTDKAQINTTTGVVTTNSGWSSKVTNSFIPVATGDIIRQNGNSIVVGEYDSSQVFLRATTAGSVTVGANTTYIKIQYWVETTIIVKNINLPTETVSAKYTLNPEVIEKATKYGFNLFNKTTVYPRKQFTINDTSGKVVATTGATAKQLISEKIFVSVGSGLKLTTNLDLGVNVFEYRSDTSFIKKTAISRLSTVTLDANTNFIRLSGDITDADIDKLVLYNTDDKTPRLMYQVDYKEYSQTPVDIKINKESLGLLTELASPKKQYVMKNIDTPFFFVPMQRKTLNDHTTRLHAFDYIASPPDIKNINKGVWVNLAGDESRYQFVLFNSDIQSIEKRDVTLKVADPARNNGGLIVAPIGDSITDMNEQYKYLKDNTPAITLVGMMKSPTTLLYNEGRSGWTLEQYMTNIYSPADWSGFSPFLHPIASGYKYYGCTKAWKACYAGEAYVKNMREKGDELGGFNASTGLRITPNVNDVMYNYANSRYEVYDGAAWVTITEANLGAFEFNYGKYLSTWNITKPNIVSIMLGTNDYGRVHWYDAKNTLNAKFTTWYNTIISSIKSVDSTIKIALLIPPYKSTLSSTVNNFIKYQNMAYFENRKNLITNFDGRDAENIYLVDVGSAVDTEKDFNLVDSSYITAGTKKSWMLGEVADDTHPATSGMNRMGMRIAAFIQAVR
jgi:lysophospholipase L1-like esterase